MTTWTARAALAAAVAVIATSGLSFAADTTPTSTGTDLNAEILALKTRIAELEKKEDENWLTAERTAQIKAIVNDVISDARKHGQFLDNDLVAGYKDGFFLQTNEANPKFKLVVGGFIQFRYTWAQYNAYNGRNLGNGKSDPGDANGFDIRRARISFAGNLFDPAITYKLEGDFYGSSSANGAFTVTDAFIGYAFNDQFKLRAGSFKVPFAKAELTSDTNLEFMERPDELLPFDPVRALGLSLYGDIIKNKMSYEININDGSNSNVLRRDTTVGTSANIDNRMCYYARWQWAGAGEISDFTDEPDLRKPEKQNEFAWLLGVAGGYESQNSDPTAFPSPQSATTVPGLGGRTSTGFLPALTPNGGLYRGTIDWSAKYQGWSFITAAYFQQVNQNSNVVDPLFDTSGFQYGFYGQAGYFVIPRKFEVFGRAGLLITEGSHNYGEWYSLGCAYYLFGNNAKISSDITYSPEAAYTDSASSNLINTHEIITRVQLQVKF